MELRNFPINIWLTVGVLTPEIYKYSQSPSGRMCQKRHVFEMFEMTNFHPFRDLDIVLGRRDYTIQFAVIFYLETVVSLLY